MSGTDAPQPQPMPVTGYRPRFTPTEQRIVDLLADGLQHTKDEMVKCLHDDLAPAAALYFHIYNIRRKIEPLGEYLAVESMGPMGVRYRMFRFTQATINHLYGRSPQSA